MERRGREREREERLSEELQRDVCHLQCTVPHQEVSSSAGLQCRESHHPAHQQPRVFREKELYNQEDGNKVVIAYLLSPFPESLAS